MEQRNDRADREGEFEPEGDVNQDSENAQAERPEGIFRQLASDQCPDSLFALDFELAIRNMLPDCFCDRVARIDRAADGDEVPIALDGLLDRLVVEMNRLERLAHLRDLDGLRRAQREHVAALEIHPEVAIAAQDEGGPARDQQSERAHRRDEAFAEEVDVLRRDEVEHRNALHLFGIDEPTEEIPPNDQRGEKRGEDA